MLSVVIVTYNTDRLLWECLSSLASHQAARRYEVVVINNGDALTLQGLPDPGIAFRVVDNPKNVGYGAALNQGARLTRSSLLLFLNADTRLPDGSTLPLMERLLDDRGVGVVAPRLSYPDGRLQLSCRRGYSPESVLGRRLPFFSLPALEPALRHHLMLDEDHGQILYPDWVQGSCLMMRRDVFDRMGGFDERFFLYFEDYDLCNRVRGSGLQVIYDPRSEVIHHYARLSGRPVLSREWWLHLLSALRYYAKARSQKRAA
jgi:N-acetylglucosaminyl-diphospho-decaprenol L-rhamnosyltransferase